MKSYENFGSAAFWFGGLHDERTKRYLACQTSGTAVSVNRNAPLTKALQELADHYSMTGLKVNNEIKFPIEAQQL